jgi:hypothetical protein
MKNSTIIGISVLAVAGASFYFYSKGKKSTTTNSTVTTPTPPTDDIKALADLGVKIEEPKVTPYVKPIEGVPLVSLENIQKSLLALGIDQTRGINELASPNYIEAKRIVGNMKEIDKMSKILAGKINDVDAYLEKLSELYGATVKRASVNKQWTNQPLAISPSGQSMLAVMTSKINALGYKVLPNFDIEKM